MKTKTRRNRSATQPINNNTDYKIEDIALDAKPEFERSKYPFHLLKVGQSFFIPKVAGRNVSPLSSIAGNKLKRTFKVRARKEDNVLGVRVFRVRGKRDENHEAEHAL